MPSTPFATPLWVVAVLDVRKCRCAFYQRKFADKSMLESERVRKVRRTDEVEYGRQDLNVEFVLP